MMTKDTVSSVGNRPSRHRIRVNVRAARRSDILRARLATALRRLDHYVVHRNVRVPLTLRAKQLIRKAKGAYLGTALPCNDAVVGHSTLDLLVIDRRNSWAGGYTVCWGESHSARARRRLARDLRAIELVLGAHVGCCTGQHVETVTVGLIDGAANSVDGDDLTIALTEIEDHFDLRSNASTDEFRGGYR